MIKTIVKIMGYDLFVMRRNNKSTNYEQILPVATYAPWLSDSLFISTYKIIENYTLVDKYRCYELWQLVEETAKLNGALIEIGVWRGGSGTLIAKKAELNEIKDTIYLCDTFTGVVKPGEQDSRYMGGEHADTSKKILETVIKKLNLENIKILVGIFPEETSHLVSDNAFRFCHIDVDVYTSAKDILDWIWPKLVVGGIIVFDDYGFQTCDGITQFVNELRNRKDRVVIHNLNGHGIIIKTLNEI
ncbi:hypothetical protein AGMMS49944_32020 [Spirochaetia bacterium]|nr:hypothetical protein AGMMS49944_32020 [Spirochaetia bacterium]